MFFYQLFYNTKLHVFILMLKIRDCVNGGNYGLPVYKPIEASRFMDRILLELAPEEFKQLIHNVNGESVIIVIKRARVFPIMSHISICCY